jgi:hypothetical protein
VVDIDKAATLQDDGMSAGGRYEGGLFVPLARLNVGQPGKHVHMSEAHGHLR